MAKSVPKQGEEHVGPSSCEAEQGLDVVFSLADLLVVVGPEGRVGQGGGAARKKACSSCLLPLRDGCSPRMEQSELPVTGTSPA